MLTFELLFYGEVMKKQILLAMLVVFGMFLAGCGLSPDARIVSSVSQIDKDNLAKHVEYLSTTGSSFGRAETGGWRLNKETQDKKRKYIGKCLKSYGYDVRQTRGHVNGKEFINIWAYKNGLVEPEHVIDLGAHYDTINNPGADDNCSGVAGVLEVARILADIDVERSVRFCFYDLEEIGGLGSRFHTQLIEEKGLLKENEIFDGAIIFEMIGYSSKEKNSQTTPIRIPFLCDPPREGDFILVVGNFQSGDFGRDFELAIEAYAPGLKYFSFNRLGGLVKDGSRSDHYNYWKRELPAIMITDTANFRNPNYHLKSDTIDTLDFDFMQQVVQAALGTVLEYAKLYEEDSKLR